MATASATTSAMPSNPSTPPYTDDIEWITAYLAIHTLSDSSRRYSYLLWVTVVFIFLIFALLHWTGSRGGFIGATWSKWSLRRRTWRKKHSLAVARRKNQPHRQPSSLPSNAQLLCLFVLLLATIALSVVGPDYIAPGIKLWQFYRREGKNISGGISFGQPQYTISKAWWTAGGRTGQIAFALLPLCILFVLKAPPFAIFAIPFMIQLFFDKLAWLHRWCGRLIWLMSAGHVALWTVQLVRDQRETTSRMALVYAWQASQFICGWIAFGLLTLIIVFSIQPLRRAHYEAFYFLHILLVPLFLVASAFHHPPIWWWCWAALALWAGERLWRGTWWLHSNGYFGGMSPYPPANRTYATPQRQDKGQAWQTKSPQQFNFHGQPLSSTIYTFPNPPQPASRYAHQPTYKSPLSPSDEHRSFYFPQAHPPSSPINHTTSPSISSSLRMPLTKSGPYVPPPGYAHAELLAGRIVRLRFISPGFLSWAPGQHFLINIPSVSKFTSHPFTVASVCDEHGPDAGRVMVLLIRTKNGWTRELWDAVVKLTTSGQTHPHGEHPNRGAEMSNRGVLMRMYVDGPFGSSVRARWGTHSTVLVVAGGSGVSFGLSVLEYVCMCLSGRDGRHLGGRPGGWGKKGFTTSRIRFVWLVREFSHIQWGASLIRRCMAMIPAPGLQIDIFVTNFRPLPPIWYGMGNIAPPTAPPPQSILPYSEGRRYLPPPTPGFAQRGGHSRNSSVESLDTVEDPIESYVDLSYYTGEQDKWGHNHEERESRDFHESHEANILDLTNFDGDVDVALPGEEDFNHTVKKQGRLRRANTRKASRTTLGARERLHERLANAESRQVYAQHRLADVQNRDGSSQSHVPTRSIESTRSTDRLLSHASPASAGIEHQFPSTMEVDLGSPTAAYSELPWNGVGRQSPPVSPDPSRHDQSERHFGNWDSRSDTTSTREMMPRMLMDAAGEVKLDIGKQEMNDISVVSEHARPGKPKLDRIVADEVENSKGSMIVACCGPTSLNAMVRKIIAAKIDPDRIRRGDMRGMIALVSEEFEY